MKQGSKTSWRIAAILAVAALASALAPAAAPAKLLLSTYNEGLEPRLQERQSSAAAKKPKRLRFELSGNVDLAVEGTFTVRCYRGKAPKFSKAYPVSGISPVTSVVRIKGGFSSCRVTRVLANFVDPFITGWVQARAWG